MTILNKPYEPNRHLHALFADITPVTITRREQERVRCIEREFRALKAAMQGAPLENTLISGIVLKNLFDLIE